MTVPPDRVAEPRSRWRAFRPDTAGAIYGTVTATAVIAASAGHGSVLRILVVALATLAVFWVAHVYAHALSHHLRGATRLRWATVVGAMGEELSMLVAPLPSLLLLLAGVLGLLDDHLAVRLALWAGVLQLVAWGVTYARRQGWNLPTAVVAGAVNGVLGVVIVLLEVFIH